MYVRSTSRSKVKKNAIVIGSVWEIKGIFEVFGKIEQDLDEENEPNKLNQCFGKIEQDLDEENDPNKLNHLTFK